VVFTGSISDQPQQAPSQARYGIQSAPKPAQNRPSQNQATEIFQNATSLTGKAAVGEQLLEIRAVANQAPGR
jgi:hypothetical protein